MKTKKEIHDHRIYMVSYFVLCDAVMNQFVSKRDFECDAQRVC